MENSVRDVDEATVQSSSAGRKNGGWITFPFIIGIFFVLWLRVEFKILSVFGTKENVPPENIDNWFSDVW